MIYPAYRVLNEAGDYRSFFWFCFARLQCLDEDSTRYSNYLSSEYEREGRRSFWEYQGCDDLSSAEKVVRIDAAFHTPEWSEEDVALIMSQPLFSDFTWEKEGEFIVVSTPTVDRKITSIMYPLFMIRNILSSYEAFYELRKLNLSVVEAAFLGSQFNVSKTYTGRRYLCQVSEDYLLAKTLEGLAIVMNQKPEYIGAKWGFYSKGYEGYDGLYWDLPETLFEVEDVVDIEDILGQEGNPDTSLDESLKLIVECFKEAMEKVNEKA